MTTRLNSLAVAAVLSLAAGGPSGFRQAGLHPRFNKPQEALGPRPRPKSIRRRKGHAEPGDGRSEHEELTIALAIAKRERRSSAWSARVATGHQLQLATPIEGRQP